MSAQAIKISCALILFFCAAVADFLRSYFFCTFAVACQVVFAVFAALTPPSQPHSKTTANAVHLLLAARA